MAFVPTFCPYVGLQPYTEADREYFFGRGRDQRLIASNLYAAPLTILYGPSGVGKSSVLLAGAVPRLRATSQASVVVFRDWQRPSAVGDLKAACVQAIQEAGAGPLTVDSALPLDELLRQGAKAVRDTVFVVLDQFEEYLAHYSQPESAFDAELARAVNRDEVSANFLLALREDALSKLDRFRTRIPNLLGNTLRLEHLNPTAAEEAIRKPLEVYNARVAGEEPITIEDVLVHAILEQVRAGRVILSASAGAGGAEGESALVETAFLQLVMTRLWDEEMAAHSRALRLETLNRLGGAEMVVRTHLDVIMTRLQSRDREVAARIFRYLVTPSGTKIAHTVPDLAAYADVPPSQLEPVLEKLSHGKVRILRPVTPFAGQQGALRYEVFHDVLAPAILDWRARYLQAQDRSSLRSFLISALLSLLFLGVPVGAFVIVPALRRRRPPVLWRDALAVALVWIIVWVLTLSAGGWIYEVVRPTGRQENFFIWGVLYSAGIAGVLAAMALISRLGGRRAAALRA